MAKKSKTSKKKAPGTTAAKNEEAKAPAAEPEAPKMADVPHVGDGDGSDVDAPKVTKKAAPKKKARKKGGKKDEGRPAGAPPADHCDAEWETKTHHIYKLKFKHVGEDGQRKKLIAK